MNLWGSLVLALGFTADAFAVSMCKGLAMKKASWKAGVICGLWFGGFQALMPLIGYYLGSIFADTIAIVAPVIAFILLALIGANMLKEAFTKDECEDSQDGDLSFKTMLVLAIATSIDALAGGLSIALDVEGDVNIFVTVTMIGITTFLFSAVGVKIGNVFGSRYEKPSQIAGGVLLIAWGAGILVKFLLSL
ncbi:MAG: manganese efflux pump [Oscillospiraceae bacterium]|nr:manganese efflux pump [Oscillospiraceae bacterium]